MSVDKRDAHPVGLLSSERSSPGASAFGVSTNVVDARPVASTTPEDPRGVTVAHASWLRYPRDPVTRGAGTRARAVAIRACARRTRRPWCAIL